MSNKRTYYSETTFWKDIKASDADIKILLSDRDCGKSFAVKELFLDNLKEDKRFVYLRRNDLETKTGVSTDYFADKKLVRKIKDMAYDGITDVRGEIYLGHWDPEGKRKTMIPESFAGFICALVSERYYKSLSKYSESNVTDIVYEEFITDGLYLKDEPAKLESLWSTFKRDGHVNIWLIGNTMSRVCPYFLHWGLRGVPRQRPGTIDRYVHRVELDGGESEEIKIDVQVIPDLQGQGYGWFSKKKDKGTGWVTGTWPHLTKRLSEYDQLHTVFVNGDMYKFRLLLLSDPETQALFWYVEPFTKTIAEDARIVATSYSLIQGRQYGTVGFRPLVPEEKSVFDLLKAGHWVVSDNLCGDDFNVLMTNMARMK